MSLLLVCLEAGWRWLWTASFGTIKDLVPVYSLDTEFEHLCCHSVTLPQMTSHTCIFCRIKKIITRNLVYILGKKSFSNARAAAWTRCIPVNIATTQSVAAFSTFSEAIAVAPLCNLIGGSLALVCCEFFVVWLGFFKFSWKSDKHSLIINKIPFHLLFICLCLHANKN